MTMDQVVVRAISAFKPDLVGGKYAFFSQRREGRMGCSNSAQDDRFTGREYSPSALGEFFVLFLFVILFILLRPQSVTHGLQSRFANVLRSVFSVESVHLLCMRYKTEDVSVTHAAAISHLPETVAVVETVDQNGKGVFTSLRND